MKRKTIMKNKRAILSSAFCAVLLAFGCSAKASTLNFGDVRDLGNVLFGIPSGDADRTSYVNHLIGMAPSTSDSFSGQTFNRSASTFGSPYPAAVNSPGTLLDGTGTSINLGAGGFNYLFAKYDGPNAGSEVWDLFGLSGVITIPPNGLPDSNNKYGLSGWTLFGPGVAQVPDGGMTVALLGLALTGLAGFRARFGKR
jgi:hypothetical protein